MNLQILPLDAGTARDPQTEAFKLGDIFTNRMFTQRYAPDVGWHEATIGPYGTFPVEPATSTFHYGQSIFEGCKAFRRPDGHVNLFRFLDHARRFNRSAQRIAMPQVDEEKHLEALTKFVELEHAWIPDAPGATLYIRPVMFATDGALGVSASQRYLHAILACPLLVYEEDVTPASVYVSDEYRRAVVGGTGEVKFAGNYAGSLLVSEAMKREGYAQVLWLDAIHGKYVEEVGTMNFFVVYNGKTLVTPALSGSILPGITRDSILTLAPDLGYTVEETQVDVHEMLTDIRAGEITEVFGTGTAAVVAPIGQLGYQGKSYTVNDGDTDPAPGPVTEQLRQALTNIQFGHVPDPYGWTLRIEVE